MLFITDLRARTGHQLSWGGLCIQSAGYPWFTMGDEASAVSVPSLEAAGWFCIHRTVGKFGQKCIHGLERLMLVG